MTERMTRRMTITAATMVAALTATACGSPQEAADGGGADAPVRVGLVYSQSGPLASYGKMYIEGFRAGLAYATQGTNKVGSRTIEVTEVDDAADPAKAVSAAKDLIGKGYKIIGGSTASGVALQVAPLAAQNKVLFLSGPAATDAITGVNRYTFRTGRQSYQDVTAARSYLTGSTGKKVLVFTQDNAFGKSNVDAVTQVLGAAGGTVTSLLAPASATDFTPFASQIKTARPDVLFVAWAGTTGPTMWQTLDQQGVFAMTKVVTGLDAPVTWPTFGPAATKLSLLTHFFNGAAAENAATTAARAAVPGNDLLIFHPDGFVAGQMVARAAQEGGDDVEKMVTALEGWSFESIKGKLTVRKEDHALLQPIYQVKLTGTVDKLNAELVSTLSADETAPPVAAMKG